MPENYTIDMPEAVRNIIHTLKPMLLAAVYETVSLAETQMTGI